MPRPRVIGRYALFGEIAAGGMATVHFGRLVGPVGFSRTVAIKRLHPHFAKDPEFVAMFLDEARLVSRIQHPNVVTTLDIVTLRDEIFLVMEYVAGESLSRLIRTAIERNTRVPINIAASILSGVLFGLHAAHEAKSELREPLGIVHRDVSPQNILVGTDGVARVLDFGVAKAAMRAQSTRDGQMKGKLSYMAPEQLNGGEADRRADVFAAGIVLWEALCGRRLFQGNDAGETFGKVLAGEILEPKSLVEDVPDELNRVTMKALERDPAVRYSTAREFAIDLESAAPMATARAVGEWVEQFAGPELEQRQEMVARIEGVSTELEDLVRTEESGARTLGAGDQGLPERGSRPSFSGARAIIPSAEASSPSRPSRVTSPSGMSGVSGEVSFSSATAGVRSASVLGTTEAPPSQRGIGARRVIWALAAALGGGLAAFLLFGNSFDRAESGGPSGRAGTQGRQAAPAVVSSGAPGSSEGTSAKLPTLSVGDLPPARSASDGGRQDASNPPSASAAPKPEPAQAASEPASRAEDEPSPGARAEQPARPEPEPEEKEPEMSCDPPWTLDDRGIRRLKPECL